MRWTRRSRWIATFWTTRIVLCLALSLGILTCERPVQRPRINRVAQASAQPHITEETEVDEIASSDPEPPQGSLERPIVIDDFPFSFEGDTRDAPEGGLGEYGCTSNCCDEGDELYFRVELTEPSILGASLGGSEGAQPTVHLHLLTNLSPQDCLDGGVEDIERRLPPGSYHLVVDGPSDEVGPFVLEVDRREPNPRFVGSMWNTFYIVADEDHFRGPRTTPLFDNDCQPITKVRRAFYNSLCIQGSGLLADKRVVNYHASCTRRCPRAPMCKRFPVRICYKVLDPEIYPWGMGKAPRPLVPDWSIAVDPDVIPLDTVVYLEELDGVTPPGSSEPHDGCVGAVDTGGGIDDDHIDIFAGTRERWLAWEELLPTRTRFKAWTGHPRCYRYMMTPDGDISVPRQAR